MSKQHVLFVCTANAARSQMAEALLRDAAGDRFEVYSAGVEPTAVHPETLTVLQRQNIDTSGLAAKHINALQGIDFDYVISLCDHAQHECRTLSCSGKKMEWNFEDPQTRSGPAPFDVTLLEIRQRIAMFIEVETGQAPVNMALEPTRFFKSLSDTVRLRTLMLIHYEGELCVCELMAALAEIQPKISRHLAVLKKDGLLVDRRQGQWMFYRINPALPAWAKSVIAEVTENNVAYIESSLRQLASSGERPQRQAVNCESILSKSGV